ncbi:MAG: hypothetical protein ABJO54_05605 [Hyphomicrobiales bacterium]
MNNPQCGVQVSLLDVAYVPGVRINLCLLHAAMQKCPMTLDADGAHIVYRCLFFMRRDAGLDIKATLTLDATIAAADFPLGIMRMIDHNDLRFVLAHSHGDGLREKARQTSIKAFWEFVACDGCA